MIEKGRYSNTPIAERKCQICDVIEDEYHFLDNCIKYDNIRSKLMEEISPEITKIAATKNPSDLIICNNMQSKLAKFVYDCFNAR